MPVGGEDYYYSSDSDDDDVDRYVFLARKPGQHAEEDTSDDETEEDEGGGDGRRGRKRPMIRDASDAASPPPTKKARLGLVIALPSPEQTPTSSGTDRTASASPCGGVRDRESSGGSEESRRDEARESPDSRKGKYKKNKTTKQPLVGGKRSRSGPGCEEEVDQELRRDVITAAAKTTSPSSAVTSAGRFQCNRCERCFDSHQALGGHVLGHQKKARIAAITAAASLDDAGVRGKRTAEIAIVELQQQDANDGVGYADQEPSVVAVGANGNGTCREKKAFDDVDTGGHRKAKKKKKKPSVVADGHHMGAHGDGNIGIGMSCFEASHEGVNDHHHNREKASSRSFHNGSEETAIGAGRSHNDADVKNKKPAAVLSSRKGASDGNGNNADACRTQYKCKVCGAVCLTGRALGGHMRKHRKQPAQGADGDGMPAAGGDSRMPVSRQFSASGNQDCIEWLEQ